MLQKNPSHMLHLLSIFQFSTKSVKNKHVSAIDHFLLIIVTAAILDVLRSCFCVNLILHP